MVTLKAGSKTPQSAVSRANLALMGHNIFQKQTLWQHTSSVFDTHSAQAAKNMKWWLGYPLSQCAPNYGDALDGYLHGRKKLSAAMHARRVARHYEKPPFVYPLGRRGTLIGVPGVGTHSWTEPPNNWQSDNAVDLGVPIGTKVVAVSAGVIDPRIGPLSLTAAHNEEGETHDWTPESAGPLDSGRFAGLRCYVNTSSDSFYYAHCSKLVVSAGQHVKAGQLLGYTGEANSVAHLHFARQSGDPRDLLKAALA
jgi:murein DD-endopeptidase MepM/ murein hydrolase activator NlpD